MRRERLGFPGEPLTVAGRPAGWWLTWFRLCHREAGGAWERIAWPDGGPLRVQPWLWAAAFETIADECRRISAEALRAAARRGGVGH